MAQTSMQRGREVRQKLVTAAAELIGEKGWGAVSTRMVADRAAVGPGLVHYHFANLQALLREAASDTITQLLDSTASLLSPQIAPHEAIAGMLSSLDEFTGQDATSMLFTETYLTAARDPELKAMLSSVSAQFRDRVTEWLRGHGQAQPMVTATVLMAAIDGLMLHRPLLPQPSSTELSVVLQRLIDDRPTVNRARGKIT